MGKDIVKHLNIPTSAIKIAKKCISEYYAKEEVLNIIKKCYVSKYSSDQTEKENVYTLIYPQGGDDWSLFQNRKSKKWSCGGHGTYFGKYKTKRIALTKKYKL